MLFEHGSLTVLNHHHRNLRKSYVVPIRAAFSSNLNKPHIPDYESCIFQVTQGSSLDISTL